MCKRLHVSSEKQSGGVGEGEGGGEEEGDTNKKESSLQELDTIDYYYNRVQRSIGH